MLLALATAIKMAIVLPAPVSGNLPGVSGVGLCSQAALDQFGAAWRTVAPDLEYVVLPEEGRLSDDEIARIDIAVFSHDFWMNGR